jgi:hypothetical protein
MADAKPISLVVAADLEIPDSWRSECGTLASLGTT